MTDSGLALLPPAPGAMLLASAVEVAPSGGGALPRSRTGGQLVMRSARVAGCGSR